MDQLSAPAFAPGIPARTLLDLDFQRLLERLAVLARTELGKRLARVPRLWVRPADVERERDLTTELREILDAGDSPPLGGISDVVPLLGRAAKGAVLEAEELLEIADAVRGIWLARRFLLGAGTRRPRLGALGLMVPDLDDLHELLYDTFDEQGQIRDDATEELRSLRAKRRSIHGRIRERIQALMEGWGMLDLLQDDFWTLREDRYVLPVKSGERGGVEGIIHGSSHTGRTLFVEPAELVPLNNELKLCEQEVLLEERRILAARTRLVTGARDGIEVGLERTAELDVALARAGLSQEMDACPAALSPRAHLPAARNPLLLLRRVPVVANDLDLGGETRFVVLTGPNAGGKTVTLNTMGLCALMARAGMHVPTDADAEIPCFEQILTVMGESQDLQADLSTFTGQLRRLGEVLSSARDLSLVLVDEVVTGTEPTQGAALAAAVMEAFADRGALGMATTHYERLKTLPLADARFRNASVGFDPTTSEPTYRLAVGHPGASSPLDVAARLGFDAAVLRRAEELVGPGALSVERTLRELEAERGRLEEARLQAETETARHQEQAERYRAMRARLEEDADRLVREARLDVLSEVERARQQVGEIVRELQRGSDPRVVHRRAGELRDLGARLRQDVGAAPEAAGDLPPRVPAFEVAEGARVHVPAFRCDGTVVSVRGATAVVDLGKLRTTVAIQGLRRATDAPAQTPAPPRGGFAVPETAALRTEQNTCDLRGMRVDEAMSSLERFLDGTLLSGQSVVYALHGHGTGKLKTGLRDALRRSTYVERFEPADPDAGGDAVTVIWLK